MTRTTRSWMAGVILGSSLVGAAPASAQNAPVTTLMVLVDDYVSVSPNILERAREETTRIFRNINVEIIWLTRGDARFEDFAVLMSVVSVQILSPEMVDRVKKRESVMGWAAPGTRLVKVQYGGIEALVGETEALSWIRREKDIACILGHVVAHELGHLLLPRGTHSGSGIMQSRLNRQLAASGGLFFTASEAQAIRTKLATR